MHCKLFCLPFAIHNSLLFIWKFIFEKQKKNSKFDGLRGFHFESILAWGQSSMINVNIVLIFCRWIDDDDDVDDNDNGVVGKSKMTNQ